MSVRQGSNIKKGQLRVVAVTVLVAFVCIILTSAIWVIHYRTRVSFTPRDQLLLRQRVVDLESENTRLSKLISYNKQSDSIRNELIGLKEMIEAFDSRVKGKLLKIYDYSVTYSRLGLGFYVATDDGAPLRNKVELIADILSSVYFHGLPVNVLRIENRDGKKIAIIDLKESNIEGASSWRGGFFQGSSGGYWTTYVLANSFLQQDYGGEWIDGVVFCYEGKPISDEWDHIFLHGTVYRR